MNEDNVTDSKLSIAPSPHVSNSSFTTRRMMSDVAIGLLPIMAVAFCVFGWRVWYQLGVCVASCLAAEVLFTRMRGRTAPIGDLSALITGLILGLSLPALAPWYIGVIGGFAAIGFGKVVFGGLGHNIFNPAMVGRAFVMIAFPAALGASAYVDSASAVDAITKATPLTVLQQEGFVTPLMSLLIGTTNGSLGETSAIAILIGGLFIVIRRTASWEIPAAAIGAYALLALIGVVFGVQSDWTVLHSLSSGAFLFGTFFIATDPVTTPLTHTGKFIYGAGFALIVVLLRSMSGYPEGVMFAILLMNALAPLINHWTIPTPFGGTVPERN